MPSLPCPSRHTTSADVPRSSPAPPAASAVPRPCCSRRPARPCTARDRDAQGLHGTATLIKDRGGRAPQGGLRGRRRAAGPVTVRPQGSPEHPRTLSCRPRPLPLRPPLTQVARPSRAPSRPATAARTSPTDPTRPPPRPGSSAHNAPAADSVPTRRWRPPPPAPPHRVPVRVGAPPTTTAHPAPAQPPCALCAPPWPSPPTRDPDARRAGHRQGGRTSGTQAHRTQRMPPASVAHGAPRAHPPPHPGPPAGAEPPRGAPRSSVLRLEHPVVFFQVRGDADEDVLADRIRRGGRFHPLPHAADHRAQGGHERAHRVRVLDPALGP